MDTHFQMPEIIDIHFKEKPKPIEVNLPDLEAGASLWENREK